MIVHNIADRFTVEIDENSLAVYIDDHATGQVMEMPQEAALELLAVLLKSAATEIGTTELCAALREVVV